MLIFYSIVYLCFRSDGLRKLNQDIGGVVRKCVVNCTTTSVGKDGGLRALYVRTGHCLYRFNRQNYPFLFDVKQLQK